MRRHWAVLLPLMMGACGEKETETPPASEDEATTPETSSLTISDAGGRGGGEMSYSPGSVTLGRQVSNRTVLVGDISSISNPADVIGCVLEVGGTLEGGTCKRPQAVDISKIPPGRVLKEDAPIEAKALSEVWYSEIIDKQTSAEVGYLVFTASMSVDDRAETVIEDVASQSIQNWDASIDAAKLAAVEARSLGRGMCGRYAITRVVATAVKYRILHARKIEGGITATFKVGGKNYYSREKLRNDLIVAIQLQPLRFPPPDGGANLRRSPAPPRVLPLAK